jgi:hypothetical protein
MFPIYTLQKHDQYGEILLIDGNESICPFKPALTVPVTNALGNVSMQVINFPCCTSCPHAHVERLGLNDTPTYNITCTGSIKEFEITDQKEDNNLIELI